MRPTLERAEGTVSSEGATVLNVEATVSSDGATVLNVEATVSSAGVTVSRATGAQGTQEGSQVPRYGVSLAPANTREMSREGRQVASQYEPTCSSADILSSYSRNRERKCSKRPLWG